MDSIPEEHDKGCNSCYYEAFNENAYPCSRCIRNAPQEDMWRSKSRDNPEPDCSWK